MELGRLEYWLLDRAMGPFEEVGIGTLGRSPDEGPWGSSPHGATHFELVSAITRMHELALIRGSRIDGEPRTLQPVMLDAEAVNRALEERDYVHRGPFTFYTLTERGGAAWEKAARPDWSRCVRDLGGTSYGNAPMMWRVETATLDYGKRYVSYVCSRDGTDVPECEVTVLRPWNPRTWKTLPEGVRLAFPHGIEQEGAPRGELDSEFHTLEPRWYSRPWEGDGESSAAID